MFSGTTLVKTFTSWNVKLQRTSFTFPFLSKSLMAWYFTKMCLFLPCWIGFSAIDGMLSQNIIVVSPWLSFKSSNNFLSHIAWFLVVTTEIYLALTIDCATTAYFFEYFLWNKKMPWLNWFTSTLRKYSINLKFDIANFFFINLNF